MIPTRIGQRSPGGYFAGINRIGTNCYAVIVSPACYETELQIKIKKSSTLNTQAANNGFSNTLAMNSAEHPAAQYCLGLVVDGCNDFYLPSMSEIDLCHRNLKPETTDSTYYPWIGKYYYIPDNNNATGTRRLETIVTAFVNSSAEAFTGNWYWTSTECSLNSHCSASQYFPTGMASRGLKPKVHRVRAVRRILINVE